MRGYVYFVESQGLVKIGRTNSLRSRLTTLQMGSPSRLRLIDYIIYNDHLSAEKEWHRRLARYRVRGEWFRIPPEELSNAIEAERQRIIAELSDRISDLQATVQDLRGERDRLLLDLEREREQTRAFAFESQADKQELQQLRQQLAIAAPPTATTEASAAPVVTTAPPASPTRTRTPWWQFWKL